MFKKSTFSKLEQILLLIPASFVPLLILFGIGSAIYDFYFPSERTPADFTIYECCPSSYGTLFGLSFVLCITISFFSLLFKRVSLSWSVLLIPVIIFIFIAVELVNLVSDLSAHTFSLMREDNFFFPFPSRYIFSISFIIFLFLWHTKILIQDKIRSNQNINLP
jgi:hypothetical protein